MHHYKTTDYESIIRWFYQAEDPAFFSTYHKRQGTLDECVKDTVDTLSGAAEFYVVEQHGCMAGFFVKTVYDGVAVLEGFHILPPFRTPLFFSQFWDLAGTVFDLDMHIGVLESNHPAIRHLTRNGFHVLGRTEYDKKGFILLQRKLSDKCH
jgi:hypothetical protein